MKLLPMELLFRYSLIMLLELQVISLCMYEQEYSSDYGKELNKNINPDEAVAYGAAVQV